MEARWDDLALSRIVKNDSRQNLVTVPLKKLDSFFSDSEKAGIRFIKMDAEGAEPGVLRGGETILEKRPHLLVEVDDRRLEPLDSSEEQLLSLLKRYEYVPFSLTRFGRLVHFQPHAHRPARDNLFFIPHEEI